MKSDKNLQISPQAPEPVVPWYRQFWPWFIIALPTAAVIASFVSLWLALSHPDQLIVTEDEYRQLKGELKAQQPANQNKDNKTDHSDRKHN